MRFGPFSFILASFILGTAALLSGCTSSLHTNTSNSTPPAKLAISTTALPAATVGTAYSATMTASGGTTPYTFSASGLPSGLSINSSTGVLSGTPAQSAVGTASVTLSAADAGQPQQSASTTLSLTVNALTTNGPTISNTSLPNGTIGASYNATINVSGGSSPFAFSASGLPAGLSINTQTGIISGTPQGPAATATVSITVTDFKKVTATASLSLTVAAAQAGTLAIGTTSLPAATVGASYSGTVQATGGATPYTFNATGLPSGFTINATSGTITGTATQSEIGTASITVTATDATQPTAQTASATLSLAIDAAGTTSACSQMSTGNNASLNGFVPFPGTSAWNTDISQAPLDPNNTAITTASGFANEHLHHDWSSVAGGNYGIPYVVVDSTTTPLVAIDVVSYASESDVAMAPFPATAPIEGSPADCTGGPGDYLGDQHVLVLDRNACMLYETFNTVRCRGAWSSDSETIWDLKNYEQRPWGWTSADAAGLPIFPGLVRYDEVASGTINHAIRFTLPHTKNDANGGYFVEPASHAAGTDYGVSNVMGMRIRLKASFDISGYSAANKVILTAMKKYGMILADNGSYFYFQGVPDPRWDDNDLVNLDSITSSNFEVVQMTPTYPGYDDNSAPSGGAPPTINSFTVSSTSVTAGTNVTLSWDTSNDSYDFIDVLGGVDGGSVSVAPTATTTYTLNATNQFGRTTAHVMVTVH
jgi:Putative Ig domain